jgi:hypothetical protein
VKRKLRLTAKQSTAGPIFTGPATVYIDLGGRYTRKSGSIQRAGAIF